MTCHKEEKIRKDKEAHLVNLAYCSRLVLSVFNNPLIGTEELKYSMPSSKSCSLCRYVLCNSCKSADTLLDRDSATRIMFLRCQQVLYHFV